VVTSVVLWDTPRLGHWTFGSRTILGCEEGPSGGFGIPAVAVTGERAFWLTAIGGNVTDWQLWSATPTRRLARRLAFASSDTDGPPEVRQVSTGLNVLAARISELLAQNGIPTDITLGGKSLQKQQPGRPELL